jgi:protein tyrosine phosphatase
MCSLSSLCSEIFVFWRAVVQESATTATILRLIEDKRRFNKGMSSQWRGSNGSTFSADGQSIYSIFDHREEQSER